MPLHQSLDVSSADMYLGKAKIRAGRSNKVHAAKANAAYLLGKFSMMLSDNTQMTALGIANGVIKSVRLGIIATSGKRKCP
ncbi:hypothetical protein [Novosphingobium humi]|uniref:Uncharacterized protein n=1 Tax=Novosphingobium humi TaxID=2282397 RepID=A0ABY7U032_9SPHN|nr:hypothetical protein [Novosphingobium humi]WCT78875.1 hypothetical protein PQ457_07935 [Novosphingobium humi]